MIEDLETRLARLRYRAEQMDEMNMVAKIAAAPKIYEDAVELMEEMMVALRESESDKIGN